MFDIRLRTITESTWKILKLDWKTPGIFFFQKSGNPVIVREKVNSFQQTMKSTVHLIMTDSFNQVNNCE